MIERYTLPEMGKIWREETKFQKWLDVELAVCEAQTELGNIPKKSLEMIKKNAKFNIKRIKEIETKTRHDFIAFLTNVAENVGEEGRYLHLGLTSYDAEDTALSLLLRESGEIILKSLNRLSKVLKRKAIEHKKTVLIGRTHGVHAEPTTLGLKFLLWYEETKRNIERMKRAIENVSYAKVSGAVGNFAHIDPRIEEIVSKKLNLKPVRISSQILDRDRHAEYLSTLAIISSSVEKFATEIRNLQRTEILELEEPFIQKQKGSSAMPHKRNPILCERICGLARLMRSNGLAAMQNIALWNERDITHSSVERVILPDSNIIADYILNKFTAVMENLVIYKENMLRNLQKTKGLIFSEVVLLKLIYKGLKREEAYNLVQRNALKSWKESSDFKQIIKKDKEIKKYLSEKEIDESFDIHYFLKNIDEIYGHIE